jgi:hypothetical protein
VAPDEITAGCWFFIRIVEEGYWSYRLPHYRLRTAGVQLSVAGRVEVEDEVALAFWIPDRLI